MKMNIHNWLPFSVILVNGVAASAIFTDRLLSVRIIDSIGYENDSCELEFDDRDYLTPMLSPGDKIIPILGILPAGGIAQIGSYTVEHIKYKEAPATLTITAQSVDYVNTSIGLERTKTYEEKTIKEIAEEIAGRNSLEAKIDPELAEIKIKHFNQNSQSDLDAMNEIAAKYGAVVVVKDEKLIVKRPFNGKDILGGALRGLVIERKDVSSINFSQEKRNDAKGVTASYIDEEKAEKVQITEGDEENTRELKEVFQDESQAREAAKAALSRTQAFKGNLSLTMPARPMLRAEQPILFKHPRAELNGAWIIEKATHEFASKGASTKLDLVRSLEDLEE